MAIAELIPPVFIIVASFVLGACVGSFLNVIIYRLPVMLERQWQREAALIREEQLPEFSPLNLALPRSSCPHCGHSIAAVENIPLLSYFVLKGRCRHCSTRISARYPLVELLTAALSVAVVAQFGATVLSAGVLVFVWALVTLSFIDFDTQLLPDTITLPLLWAGVMFNMFTGFISLEESILGTVLGYLSLWSIYWLFKLTTGKEGMGHGDFKLLAMIGAFLGWKPIILVVLLSSSLGAIVGIWMILRSGNARSTQIPFGPYLAVAAVIVLFVRRTHELLPFS